MKKHILTKVALAIAVASSTLSASAIADSSIPVADFFKKSTYSGRPLLSPDGSQIAVLTPRNGRFVLAVIDLATNKPRVVASDPDWNITNVRWINNKRLTFSLTKGSEVVLEQNLGGGLFAVNIDGSDFRKLVPTIKEAMAGNAKYKPYNILKRVGGDSNDVLVVDNARSRQAVLGASDVHRMDTTTGRTQLLTFDNPGKVGQWVIDHNNIVRVAVSLDVDASNKRIVQTVYHRKDDKSAWGVIHKAYIDEGKQLNPVGFDFDNQTLLVAGRLSGQDKSAIYTWDFAKNQVGEMIADHPDYDIDADNLLIDDVNKKIIGFVVEGMKNEIIYFDTDYAKLQASLEASFPKKDVFFSWRGNNAVVTTSGVNDVGTTYLFNTAKKTLEFLYTAKPEFEGKKLSEQTIINYAARDGLNIPAYLTLPEGKAAKNLPLVAYVHGGPHARDGYGFDPVTQTLASRGYAVLQPQFRMSTGFGWKHHTAGWKQWGLAMQDDVTDGVNALVKQGIVDPNRVCIIGASYGGYATMYGLAKNPDLYKCGINWVGVTDVKMLFTVNWSDMSGPMMDNMGTKMHGDPKTDLEYMKNSSALENVDKIKAPVLMAYGSEDYRVPLIHGEKMRDKLLKQGNTVEWMVMVGEGHGWAKESNNILWGETMLNFLNRYIGNDPNKKGSVNVKQMP